MSAFCDGVIVGSAVVNQVAAHGKDAVPYIAQTVKELREGLDG